jgi:hypothetical protein
MGWPSVTAKLGTQRKAQRYLVSPMSDGRIMVQSDRAIGTFFAQTGKGVLNIKGSYFMHLNAMLGAKEYTFPAEFVAECVRVCPQPGGETALGGGVCIVQNSVQVI